MSAGNNCRNHPAIYSSSKILNISAGLGGTIKAETHELKTERSSASGRPASSVCWCRLIFCLLQIYPGTAQLSSGSRQERQRGEQQLLLHLLPQPPSLHPLPLPPPPGEVWLELGFTDCLQRKPARWLQLVFSAQSRKSDNNNDNYHLHN